MADYLYTGVTTYIKDNDHNVQRLSVLTEAITSLEHKDSNIHDINSNLVCRRLYSDILYSDDYKTLYDNDAYFYTPDYKLPDNIPNKYKHVTTERVTIKGYRLIRIYIPICSKHMTDIMVNSYKNLMTSLFHNQIINMSKKSGYEHQSFDECEKEILISASRHSHNLADTLN